MIHSMTGYGKSASTIGSRRYTAEVRSLNGKQLDLSVRMPQAFREKEMELRKLLSSAIVRGKSDINLHYEADATDQRELNIPLIEHYLTHLEKLADKKGYEKDGLLLGTAMRLPDTVQQSREEVNEDEWKQIRRLVEEAVSQFLEFRIQEGKTMEMDLLGRVEQILELESKLDPLLTERIERVRDRIQANFDEIKDRGRLDENRFEQEVLFYIEKMDVSEERVRLKAHCQYFMDILETDFGQGKKLAFIAQEMGREINTLGSKANDAEIQRFVVQMKDELEKIKEQVLNVL
ncbi:MAG: YicC family protein [Flavobacteriales bacterium]|nr:YicC family protein [Flavobacteriales bacterium]